MVDGSWLVKGGSWPLMTFGHKIRILLGIDVASIYWWKINETENLIELGQNFCFSLWVGSSLH